MTDEAIPVLHVSDAARSVEWYRRLGYEEEWTHRFEPIADFTPKTTGDANLGVSARCGAGDCVLVYVSPIGTAWILQRTGGGTPTQKFKDSAQVQLNQPNRLVVALHGSQVQSWLNGNLISSVQVDVAGPGAVGFFLSNQDVTPSTVNLLGLYVYAAG